MKRITIILCFFILTLILDVAYAEQWWQKWDNYPKVPRITAKEVKNLMLAGEKIVFVYSGYKTDQVVCGSFYVPYTKVPPNSDGSTVNFKIPKHYWVMCY